MAVVNSDDEVSPDPAPPPPSGSLASSHPSHVSIFVTVRATPSRVQRAGKQRAVKKRPTSSVVVDAALHVDLSGLSLEAEAPDAVGHPRDPPEDTRGPQDCRRIRDCVHCLVRYRELSEDPVWATLIAAPCPDPNHSRVVPLTPNLSPRKPLRQAAKGKSRAFLIESDNSEPSVVAPSESVSSPPTKRQGPSRPSTSKAPASSKPTPSAYVGLKDSKGTKRTSDQ